MTHIEQLIKDLCPHGVEWKTMGEVCTINRGVRVIKSELETQGLYPVYQNSLTPLGYYKKSNYPANTTFIISAGAAGKIGYSDVDFWAADDCLCIICPGSLLSKFLYYCMTNKQDYFLSQVRHASVPRMSRNVVENFEIPLPPLEIQEKIVECLDKFSTLAAELQAELQMRRKQYEYYRTQLLTPHSDCNSATNTDDRKLDSQGYTKGIAKVYDWQWKTLGEICYSIRTGLNPRKFFRLNTEDATNYYITIREIQNNCIVTTEKTDRMNDEALTLIQKRSNIEKGDLLFSGTGTIGQMYVVTETPRNWGIKEGIYVLKPKAECVLTKFLYYILATDYISKKINDKVAGGIVMSIPMKELMAISIPLPSIEEQERIVAILDKFEALTTSLSDGIPAEQAAQQKRYEYYRDRLLSFPRGEE